MAEEMLKVTADGIQIVLSEHGAKLLIQEGDAPQQQANGQLAVNLRIVAVVNLSHEHLKLFTIFAHRQLADYEKENGPIPLNKKVLTSQNIDLAKEW